MTIPLLPAFFDMIYSKSDGHLSADGYLYNDQMFQVLNNLLMMFNNSASTIFMNYPTLIALNINAPFLIGINPPSFTSAQISAIVAITPSIIPLGTMWYNSSMKKLQFLSDVATIQTITSA